MIGNFRKKIVQIVNVYKRTEPFDRLPEALSDRIWEKIEFCYMSYKCLKKGDRSINLELGVEFSEETNSEDVLIGGQADYIWNHM